MFLDFVEPQPVAAGLLTDIIGASHAVNRVRLFSASIQLGQGLHYRTAKRTLGIRGANANLRPTPLGPHTGDRDSFLLPGSSKANFLVSANLVRQDSLL